MKKLAKKQLQIYDYILKVLSQQGYPPSVREIGEAVGLNSPSTVHFHLNTLEREGFITRAEGKNRAISVVDNAEEESRRDKIPVLGNVAAGVPILAEESVEEYITFDTQGHSGEHFALRVRGDSMTGAGILPGDLVVVRQQQAARTGDIVVALLGDEATVKRLSLRNGETWLLPENPDYEPINGAEAGILGRVVALYRGY